MPTPFQEANNNLEPQLRETLSEDGIYDTPSSAAQVKLLWEQSQNMAQLTDQCPLDDSSFDQIADWIGTANGECSTNNKRKSEFNPETHLKRIYAASLATTQWDTPIGMQAQRH